jgi:signal transduction histidine kinase
VAGRRGESNQTRVWLSAVDALCSGDPGDHDGRLPQLRECLPGMAYRCLTGRDWAMEAISSWCLEISGFPAADFLSGSVSWWGLVDPSDRDESRSSIRRAVELDQEFDLHYRVHGADGKIRWVWDRGRRARGPAGMQGQAEGLILDLTPQLELCRYAYRNLCYEAIARTIRRSVHDMNNLFTSMIGFLDLLAMSRQQDADLVAQLVRIRGLAERAMEVNRRTREAAHQQTRGHVLISVADLTRRVADSVAASDGTCVPVLVSPCPGTLTVSGDPVELEQALSGLVINALEAEPKGPVEIRPQAADGMVRIEVRDSGTGIGPEDCVRVSQPFFSTKGRPGMGLTVSGTIARDHGGSLEIQSTPGKGSVVALVLPLPRPAEDEFPGLDQLLR